MFELHRREAVKQKVAHALNPEAEGYGPTQHAAKERQQSAAESKRRLLILPLAAIPVSIPFVRCGNHVGGLEWSVSVM